MILSNELTQLGIPYLEKIQNFFREYDLIHLENGKYELGDACYASVSEYETKKDEEIVYEAHEQYIDVQYLILGREIVWLTKKENSVCIREYDDVGDYALYKSNEAEPIILSSGYFLVLQPDDLHAPGYSFSDGQKVKKIVFKIKKN